MIAEIKNIQFWVNHYLKPMKKSGCKRKFKLDIDTRLSNRLRGIGFNGIFKDASDLIKKFNLPETKVIEGNKVCKIARIQARVSNPKTSGGYTSKPSITIRFIIKFGFA